MKQLFSLLLVLSGVLAHSQNAARKLERADNKNNRLELVVNDGRYIITPYSENIVETAFVPKGQEYKSESHAVVLAPQKVSVQYKDGPDAIEFSTKGIAVFVQKAPFQISYRYKGKLLLSEKEGYIKKDSTEALSFNLEVNEVLYGGGARAMEMNRRGHRLQLYNRAQYGYGDRAELLNYCMPIAMSSKIYAVHFDNAPIGWLDFDSKKNNTLVYETISGRKTYQVIAADNWVGLTEHYTQLTGRQPLPPRWAFGNFASRFGYHSEKQTRAVVQKFREEQIPLDAVILDLYWFGKEIQGTLGNFEFLRDSFPTPEKMIADFKKDNVKTILITEPFVLTTSKKWQEAVTKNVLAADKTGKPYTYDFYFGNTGIIDLFKKEGRDWFWNIYKTFTDMGVSGWWGDLGEPEAHPSFVQHATGSADEVHNIYGHNWAKLVYEGYRKDFPGQRPFILMRSGYSGTQRYGIIPWSGDVGRSWGGLKSQPGISLQMGMQGTAYMHSDLGGFAGDNVDDELYVRWLQYGIFQPVFRPHAAESVPPEPVFRKPEIKELAKQAVELRYKMLPYNYTIAFENSLNGTPLMRPLFFEEPDNRALLTISDEYLWGNDILVAPVLEQGAKERQVYFPAGSNWYSPSGQKFRGGSNYVADVTKEAIPYYFRAGSFIPMLANTIQSTEAYGSSRLAVRYIHDDTVAESSGMYYEDDGKTSDAYIKGLYEKLYFTGKTKGNSLTITVKSETGKNYKGEKRDIDIVVFHNNREEKKTVTLKSGGKAKIKFKL